MVQEPSSTLHGTVCTNPTFDFGLPVVLFFFHKQLLSNAVAQMMTPPRAGMAAAMTPHLSESDMAKMRKPHIVYASSYDAIYFQDATVRLKQHARKTVLECKNLGNTFPPPPKMPSRGIHGMSRLVNKILASSYHTQSCTPSVFDGVIKISQDLTKDCDVVLYTMALGYDVEYLGLETEYSDGEEREKWWETTVCTIAFVPSENTLVKKNITHYCQSLAKMKNENIDTLQAPFWTPS
jgi:hypothetical protein